MITTIIETGGMRHHGRGIGVMIIDRVDMKGKITLISHTASVEGARVETVMMVGSVDIDLVGVEAGVQGAKAERQTETGGRKSKSQYRHEGHVQSNRK